jgi:putative membrane protein
MNTTTANRQASLLLALLVTLAAVFLWSVISPNDRFTWYLEAAPVMLAVPLLAVTFRAFPLTSLAYCMIWLHAMVLLVGAHYTYAEVPLFDWIRDTFGYTRNHYDRVGHIAQGFFPAIIAREVLLRRSPLVTGKWLFFLTTCVCLAISAFYELVEWWVAIWSGSEAVAFLATQGDVWDTQWDMALALSGAVASQLLFAGLHDRQIDALAARVR